MISYTPHVDNGIASHVCWDGGIVRQHRYCRECCYSCDWHCFGLYGVVWAYEVSLLASVLRHGAGDETLGYWRGIGQIRVGMKMRWKGGYMRVNWYKEASSMKMAMENRKETMMQA
jgi:hypothetical protein